MSGSGSKCPAFSLYELMKNKTIFGILFALSVGVPPILFAEGVLPRLSERILTQFPQVDRNGDGKLTKDEIQRAAEMRARSGAGGPGGRKEGGPSRGRGGDGDQTEGGARPKRPPTEE